jgi:acetoin utilization deacetylase AcuC-like enzyme
MSNTAVFYDPIYLEHDTGYGHPERPERLEATLQVMDKAGLSEKVGIISPRDATVEEIQLVHPKSYIEKVRKVAESGGGWLDPDTHVGTRSYAAALKSSGAVLEGLERIFSGDIDNAFCLVRPPGHHATAERGMGFCIFDNNAIAARFAIKEFGISRVFILDWDAHHGNGLQDIFYDDEKVLYTSLHQYPHYPGTGAYSEVGIGDGEGFTVNFPLPARSGEEIYLAAFDQVIIPMARQYKPELVLISAGYDGHFSDLLCSMLLRAESYAEMATRLKELAEAECGGRIMAALEGGYDLAGIAASITDTIAVLCGAEVRVEEVVEEEVIHPSSRRGMEIVEATREALSPYWDL